MVRDVAVIDLEGHLTHSSDETIVQAYQEASDKGTKKILLTFCEKDFLNSAGVGLLISLVAYSRTRDEVVRIAQPSEHFREVFRIVGLTQYVELFPSTEEALEDF